MNPLDAWANDQQKNTPQILIVEDEWIFSNEMYENLKLLGYNPARPVDSGPDAVRFMQEQIPDLVLMDIHLRGEMDGIETARALKEIGRVPILFLTAHADEVTLAEASRIFPYGYIIKPVEMVQLKIAIDMALCRFHMEEKLYESENKLKALINHQFQLTGLLDLEGRIVLVNETALELVGATLSEVQGLFFWDSPWWRHSQEERKKLMRVFPRAVQGQFVRYDTHHHTREGEERYIDFSLKPLLDRQGRVTFVIPEGRDITEQKRTEARLKETLNELNELKDRLQEENVYLQEEIKEAHNFEEIIGVSAPLKKVLHDVELAAQVNSTVLILGETGTGKELIARAIHNASDRKDRPLIKVNCAALPVNLIESELFGHEKGAFTGAHTTKKGKFELAHGGTIFLDEIGDLPAGMQVKLLRVLQEGEIDRVGSQITRKVDVRVIAATNRDLQQMALKGEFRRDLYFRLNVFPVNLPPLRDRPEDIPYLASHFIGRICQSMGRAPLSVTSKTMVRLQAYQWPGNVRELENIIERAIVFSRGQLLEVDENMWASLDDEGEGATGLMSLVDHERAYILQVLSRTGWVVEGEMGAARILDINPATLRSRMKKLAIQRPETQ